MGVSCKGCSLSCRGKDIDARDEMLIRPTQKDIKAFLNKVSSSEFIENLLRNKSDKDYIKETFDGISWDIEHMNLASTIIYQRLDEVESSGQEIETLCEQLNSYRPEYYDPGLESQLPRLKDYFLLYMEGYIMLQTLLLGKGQWWRKYKAHVHSTLAEEIQLYTTKLRSFNIESFPSSPQKKQQKLDTELQATQNLATNYLSNLYGHTPNLAQQRDDLVQEYLADLYAHAYRNVRKQLEKEQKK